MNAEWKRPLPYKKILPGTAVFLLLSAIPYIVGLLVVPEGKAFVGTFVNPDDLSTYLSAMRQGQEGEWLYHFPFSPEPWQPKLMLLPYLLVGKLVPTADFLLWFHLFRIGAQLFTLTVLWWWVRVVFGAWGSGIGGEGLGAGDRGVGRVQLTSWLLIVFGAGFGWLLAILGAGGWLLPDLFAPEMSTLMALFHTPHFALGLGLEVLFFCCVIKMLREPKRWRWAVLGTIVGVVCALTYVYHLPILGLTTGLFLLGRAWQQRKIVWGDWVASVIVLLPLLLLLIYYNVIAYQDPFFAAYAQNEHIIPAPPPVALLAGLGLLAVLAILGTRRWFGQSLTWLVPIWAVANVIILYLPIIAFTGRFLLGLLVPVATMAGFGLETAVLPTIQQHKIYNTFSRLSPTPDATLRRIFFLFIVPAVLIVPLIIARSAAATPDFPTYIPQTEAAAMQWLSQHVSEEDVVLADYPTGNYLPRLIRGKVFLGQLDFTTDLDGKLTQLNTFWHEDTPVEWRSAFLEEWGIDYIYQGSYERQIMRGEVIPPGEIVYDRDGIFIYRVENQ